MSDEILAVNGIITKDEAEAAKSASSKNVENKSTHVTTLKVPIVKSRSGRVDVGAMMARILELFKRALEQPQNKRFELLNENVQLNASQSILVQKIFVCQKDKLQLSKD